MIEDAAKVYLDNQEMFNQDVPMLMMELVDSINDLFADQPDEMLAEDAVVELNRLDHDIDLIISRIDSQGVPGIYKA